MTKYFYLVLMTLMIGANASALSYEEVRAYDGQYSFDITKNVEVRSLIQTTLTGTFAGATPSSLRQAVTDDFLNAMAVNSPATFVDGRYLIVSGCEPHNCGGGNRSLYVLDAVYSGAVYIVRKNLDILSGLESVAIYASGAWTQNNPQIPESVQKAISEM